ncbi:N-6 DNA methylase [Streptomyces sp. NPDC006670]|uniref:N-6 DNA methylase n=1 Tax=Streptomyces sp. NPDC006670 TaxID=3154476 RepID=UPI0033CFB2E4
MSERRRYEPVTLGEIKELAEVGRPTVSNWRRRHESFPKPVGGSDSKPLFDTEEIARWLDERPVPDAEPGPDGTLPTYGERFRSGLRLRKLVALGHGEQDADDLLVRALAVAAMAGEAGGTVEEGLYGGLLTDLDRAGQQVEDTVAELIDEMGSAGAAADIVLGLAGRLESDLAMDETPVVVADLIAALAEPVLHGPDPRTVVNLCAGIGELLFAIDDVDALGEVVAVEPDSLRRRLLAYRLLAHWMAEGVELCADTAELADIRPQAQRLRSGTHPGEQPWGFPLANLVLADPPYASGEREDDEDGPLSWAMEAVRRLRPEGLGLVVVPAWTLSRPRGGKVTANVLMREDLFRADAVAAVVQLPRRIHAFRTGAEHALLMLRGAADGPRQPSKVLLIDADRLARRVGDEWPRHVVGLLHSGETPMTEEAQRFHVVAPAPGLPSLLDGRSVLPAHRLVAPHKEFDHMAATREARQDAYAALPHLKQWIADLGIAERDPKAEHHNVGAQLRAGQLRLLPGHRIRESDIGEAGFPVIGREEMLGALAIGARRIMPEVLSAYPQARYTEAGDVLLLTEYGVHAHVDDAGGCVLLAPVQGLRIPAYQAYKAALAKGEDVHPERLWMRPHPLAALLTAPRNQQRGSGSLVRRVSVRDMDLPQLSPHAVADLETVVVETERHRAEVRRQLAALDTLAERLAAGVADGDLLVRKRS